MILAQSILQIIFESLPISSSGHILLLEHLMQWQALTTADEYIVHGPTILILMIYFRGIWIPLLFSWRCHWRVLARMLVYAASVELVTAGLYFTIRHVLPTISLWIGFFITACLLISLYWVRPSHKQVTYHKLLLIGCVQGIAAVPGISRLASTYVVGVCLGLSPHKSFSVSCMLQFPLICAGFLVGVYHLRDTMTLQTCSLFSLASVGVATVVAYYLLRWTEHCMETRNAWKFGLYLLLPMILALITENFL